MRDAVDAARESTDHYHAGAREPLGDPAGVVEAVTGGGARSHDSNGPGGPFRQAFGVTQDPEPFGR